MGVDPDSFKGKVYLTIIDKLIIGGIVALMLLYFQYRAHQYQEMQEAGIAVSKIYTGIILKQREEIIDLMSKYFMLLENVKSSGMGPDEIQKKESKDYLHRIRFITYTLCGATPKDLAEEDKQEVEKAANDFKESISEMNVFLLEREVPSIKELESKTDEIKKNYLTLLDKLRIISIKTVKSEMVSAQTQK